MRRTIAKSADLVARVWMIGLRRKRPRDIWQCVRSLIETDEITYRFVPLTLSPDQVTQVKRKAIDLVADCVAVDPHALI